MFCIKSCVITLGSIERYDFVTVWTSMDDGPYWVILLMYGSHDMRHTGFRKLTLVNGTLDFWGVTATSRLASRLITSKFNLRQNEIPLTNILSHITS